MSRVAIVVIAKECVPGRVKTRLTPALSPERAAQVAAASLADTLETVAALPVSRRVLFFQGTPPTDALTAGFDVMPQPEGDLDERLGHLFDRMSEPTILVGMDTPQLTPAHLEPALHGWDLRTDAWIGGAADGGFWALALRHPSGDLLRGVAMSRSDTGARQRARLDAAGLRVGELAVLRDVDRIEDLAAVAAEAPASRLARVWAQVSGSALAGESVDGPSSTGAGEG